MPTFNVLMKKEVEAIVSIEADDLAGVYAKLFNMRLNNDRAVRQQANLNPTAWEVRDITESSDA